MSKYHINTQGMVKKCSAKNKCPFGEMSLHFNSKEDGFKKIEELNNKSQNYFSTFEDVYENDWQEYRMLEDVDDKYYDDERFEYINSTIRVGYSDLTEQLKNYNLDSEIIAIANVDTWNGKHIGYKELSDNLSDILTSNNYDNIELERVNGNVILQGHHHDGTNVITYRKWKPKITEAQKEKLLNAIYNQNPEYTDLIDKYTDTLIYDLYNATGL